MPTHLSLLLGLLLLAAPLAAQTGLPGIGQRPPLGDVGRLPDEWSPGKFDRRTGEWLSQRARNIKWVARLGSQTFGSPIVAGGKVYVGTNNAAAYLSRYPDLTDLGCLLCFRESDGQFLWQHSSEKLPTGRVHDWPLQGIQCSPWVEGDRAWFVTNRGEVICLDTAGFADGEDDGEPFEESSVFFIPEEKRAKSPVIADLNGSGVHIDLDKFLFARWKSDRTEWDVEVTRPHQQWKVVNKADAAQRTFSITLGLWGLRIVRAGSKPGPHEADVLWRLDMMDKLGSRQHNNSTCCVTAWKNTLFVCTGNGVDEGHINLPAPDAPSFIALDKRTGAVLWTSNLPGRNIHHGNWSSPAVGVLGGVPQVIFNGGDGWTYSFHAEEWKDGQPQLLWKFDTNAKEAELLLGGRGTRNEPIAPPVLHDGRVYLTTGQDAEHGEGTGCIWCVDPTKRGDVSAELVIQGIDPKAIVPHRRVQAVNSEKGENAIPNPNSAVVWKYSSADANLDGKTHFTEQMHRTLGPVAIEGDLLFATDFSGVVHCLDRKTGRSHWGHDALAAIWAPPFIADGKVYIVDEDGDVAIFYPFANPNTAGGRAPKNPELPQAEAEPIRELNMGAACYTPPTASHGVLFIATKDHLFAIEGPKP